MQSKSYLVSPVVVAATAIEGELVDPRDVFSATELWRIREHANKSLISA